MKHYILFIVRDTYDPSPIIRFLEEFRHEYCSLSRHLAVSGAPHLRQFVQCGGRVHIAVIHATLAPVKACHSMVKCWYDSDFDKMETAIETIYNVLHPLAENVNDSILIRHSDATSLIMDHLLDSLPDSDVAKLHVVLDEQLVPLWPFTTACEQLAGSLLRSAEWHAAVFYPLGRESARSIIAEWLEVLDGAAPVNPADRVLLSTHIDNYVVQIAVDIVSTEHLINQSSSEDDCPSGVRWSPSCEVVSQIQLQSVPLTLFCAGLSMYVSDTEFLNRRGLGSNDGLLIRFNGWTENTPLLESALTTRNWRQAVRRRQLEPPVNPERPEPTVAMHFLLTTSGTVYPLVSEVNMDFVSYFRPFQNVTLPGALDLPILGPLLSNAEDCKRLAHLQATDPYPYLADPADFPMRARLLPVEDNKDNQLPAINAVAWSAKEIAALFDIQSGCALGTSEVIINIPSKGLLMKPTLDVSSARQMPWPDILSYTSHDVYYNRSVEDERFERACHRWKEGALRRPTATSLDSQPGDSLVSRRVSQFSRTNRSRHSPRKNLFEASPQSRRRSPRKHKQITSPFRNSSQVLRRNPFKDILREVSNSTMDSDAGPSSRQSSLQNIGTTSLQSSSSCRVRPFSKTESHEEALQSQPAKRSRSEVVDNEKLKRKLRDAVATALEEHGVDLQHPLFTTCGKKLFAICKTYAVDLVGTGRTSELLLNVAKGYAKQVVDCELALQRLIS
ncbi:uncharacterized protein LOC111263189 [Varroa jacobsoni]|uniref:MDN2-binding protein C-terminal domain-containing protein n=1 Tax=Varroa destructor TaxID=109461 RepID=A0A7M7JLN4_VARDE|nr:uncharacterized protein LOC111247419 [Varroa destructor]XP_022693814.1 uncharacterized protein LOC111263189 [Varroa jacobsoni]